MVRIPEYLERRQSALEDIAALDALVGS